MTESPDRPVNLTVSNPVARVFVHHQQHVLGKEELRLCKAGNIGQQKITRRTIFFDFV
jgi:hypothetical protein